MEEVIRVEGVSKKFCRNLKQSMVYGSMDVFRNMLGIPYQMDSLRKDEFWALDDVEFGLKQGEALGIIGQNGSGKTTLLRLINGIFPPDKGRISIRGRIGALIAVGAGFHPHMTGRENIYLNGTILGMNKQRIRQAFDSIIDFADIGDFLDAPVATYSSGMTVRLGFSIAVHSNPEILLADEVLAVGDLQFALKCYRKITDYRQKGGSILLVSHGMQLIRNTCNHVLWLDHGRTRAYGEVQTVCDQYEDFTMKKDAASDGVAGNRINNDSSARVDRVSFLDGLDQPCTEFRMGESFKVRIEYDCKRPVNNPIFTIGILTSENILLVANYSNYDGIHLAKIEGKGHVDFIINDLRIKPGNYLCTVTFAENELAFVLDWHEKCYGFGVTTHGKTAFGLVQPIAEWHHSGN